MAEAEEAALEEEIRFVLNAREERFSVQSHKCADLAQHLSVFEFYDNADMKLVKPSAQTVAGVRLCSTCCIVEHQKY